MLRFFKLCRAGEMTQWLRAYVALPKDYAYKVESSCCYQLAVSEVNVYTLAAARDGEERLRRNPERHGYGLPNTNTPF